MSASVMLHKLSYDSVRRIAPKPTPDPEIEILYVNHLNSILEQDHRFIKGITKQVLAARRFIQPHRSGLAVMVGGTLKAMLRVLLGQIFCG